MSTTTNVVIALNWIIIALLVWVNQRNKKTIRTLRMAQLSWRGVALKNADKLTALQLTYRDALIKCMVAKAANVANKREFDKIRVRLWGAPALQDRYAEHIIAKIDDLVAWALSLHTENAQLKDRDSMIPEQIHRARQDAVYAQEKLAQVTRENVRLGTMLNQQVPLPVCKCGSGLKVIRQKDGSPSISCEKCIPF